MYPRPNKSTGSFDSLPLQTRMSTDADHYYLSYVRPFLGGTLGVSWIQVGLGSIVQTSSEVDVNNEVQNLGLFSYFSNAYLLAYGKKINDHISFGITGKYLTSDMVNITAGQAYGYSITPGFLVDLRQNKEVGLRVGLKIDELINQQSWGTGTVEQAPAKLRIGLAYQPSNRGTLALDLSQTLREGYGTEVAVGYEWQRDVLAIRLGYNDGGLTAGAGFDSGQVQVDYAYVTQQDLSRDNVHRVSLTGSW